MWRAIRAELLPPDTAISKFLGFAMFNFCAKVKKWGRLKSPPHQSYSFYFVSM
jgi:hypothetical protein